MKLPLNEKPSILSYVQYSYPIAIIESRELLNLYVKDMSSYEWYAIKNDIEFQIQNENMKLWENTNRIAEDFTIERNSRCNDCLLVKTEYIKLADHLAYIALLYEVDGKRIFDYGWNQYCIFLNGVEYNYDTSLYKYHKVIRDNDTLSVFVSIDGEQWELISSCKSTSDNLQNGKFIIHCSFGRNQYLDWKYMNYMQLFFCPNDPNSVWLDYYLFPRKGIDASYQCHCNFIDTIYTKLEEEMSLFSSVENMIRWHVDHQYYLNLALDEYYIPNRWAYQRKHNSHYNLVYGYDLSKRVVNILGYNELGKVSSCEVPFENFRLSERNIVKYRYSANSYPFVFDIQNMIMSIEDYLEGRNSALRFSSILGHRNGIYGLEILSEFLKNKNVDSLLINDKRISYVLSEHSYIMKERLEYLYFHDYIQKSEWEELNQLCLEMCDVSEVLKSLVLKNLFLKNMIDDIYEQLEELYLIEKKFYSTLLSRLKYRVGIN